MTIEMPLRKVEIDDRWFINTSMTVENRIAKGLQTMLIKVITINYNWKITKSYLKQ